MALKTSVRAVGLVGILTIPLVSGSDIAQASSSSIVMSDRLANSVAGRIVQRRFEKFIGQNFFIVERWASIDSRPQRGITSYIYTGKLDEIIIPAEYGRYKFVIASFSEVKPHNKEAKERDVPRPDHLPGTNHTMHIPGPQDNSHVPLLSVPDIAGTEFPKVGEHVSPHPKEVNLKDMFESLTPSDAKAISFNSRVLAKYCQGKEVYCELLVEELITWSEAEKKQATIKIEPLILMLKDSEVLPVGYAGG